MTRRTTAVTTPPAIEATTELGSGLVLPIAKALTHIMAIFTAITRAWPMTVEDATAELEEASTHLRNAVIPHALMTAETTSDITSWADSLQTRLHTLQANLDHAAPLATYAEGTILPSLQDLARDTWQLLTNLDRELTGLENNNTDPGRLP